MSQVRLLLTVASNYQRPSSSSTPPTPKNDAPRTTAESTGAGFRLDIEDAFTPDPGTEDMFVVPDNKFAFSPGQLSKLLNPKSHNAFYALGGLRGLEKGLRTDCTAGLSVDEASLDGAVTFEEVAPKGTPKFGTAGSTPPEAKAGSTPVPQVELSKTGGFLDRKRIYGENRLPEKKTKSIWELCWQTYNDKVLILLTGAAVVSLALGLYQALGTHHEDGEPKVEWVEGVAILVAIILVVVVGTVNDCMFANLLSVCSDALVSPCKSHLLT